MKSSLSEYRSKVSYQFFEDIFREQLQDLERYRKKYRGFNVYAIDGDSLDLPATTDVIENGFRGYPTSKNRETHYPKMYTVQVLDIVNNVVRDFLFSEKQDEVHLARSFVQRTSELNSISIYDRLHCGYDTFLAHKKKGNYFIVRARTGFSCATSGKGVHLEVQNFIKSNNRSRTVLWYPTRGHKGERQEIYVRLIKIKNPKTQEDYVFVTNLPEQDWSRKEIAQLYGRRWDIETSFKELTYILKMSQWHSKKINGILQEIFALCWLANSVRFCMQKYNQLPSADLREKDYRKSNFKITTICFLDYFHLLLRKKWIHFWRILEFWIFRMTQTRTRNLRSYPRVVKHRGREYKYDNLVPRRA